MAAQRSRRHSAVVQQSAVEQPSWRPPPHCAHPLRFELERSPEAATSAVQRQPAAAPSTRGGATPTPKRKQPSGAAPAGAAAADASASASKRSRMAAAGASPAPAAPAADGREAGGAAGANLAAVLQLKQNNEVGLGM